MIRSVTHFSYVLVLCMLSMLTLFCNPIEVFETSFEALYLKNIRQITVPSMGFKKAGEAYFSPDDTHIIFQAVPTGQDQYQIYVMDLEERIPRLVSSGKGACTCAYFRPDGKKIIFASSHEDPQLEDEISRQETPGYARDSKKYTWQFTPYMNIYEANPDGSGLVPLTSGSAYHAECSYSFDGSCIVYASNENGSMNIYTMLSDGSNKKQITHTFDSYNGGPFFSPDGSQILFRADREKRHFLQLYLVDQDGIQEQQLTSNSFVNWAPYWHPNGTCVAYTTSRHGHEHYEIYLLHLETRKQLRLTHSPGFDGIPVFNTKGNKILWTSKRGPDNTSQIFLADFVLPDGFEK